MLVLSRKIGERIVIGDDVTIVVNRISGNRVSIGIEAPDDVKVIRGELKRYQDEFADEEATPAATSAAFPMTQNRLSYLPRTAR